jgi:hypothetical protein
VTFCSIFGSFFSYATQVKVCNKFDSTCNRFEAKFEGNP